MIKIAITLNGVVRDISPKIDMHVSHLLTMEEQQKDLPLIHENIDEDIQNLNDNPDLEKSNIKQSLPELNNPIHIPNYLDFYNTPPEYQEDIYQDNAFSIFGAAGLKYPHAMRDLNKLYSLFTTMGSCVLLSEERENSKPATLYFLAANNCRCNNIKWVYSYELVAETFDLIVTANPFLYQQAIKHNKKAILIEDIINRNLNVDKVSDLNEIIKQFNND